ncbi:MAG: hypothetical protein OXD43_10900 [Bacteroidetes bacterium]|nr:hypothetical protein [Bacteroidota bacterium]
MQSHRPSFQQTNEAGDAETLQWDIDLMDVQFLPQLIPEFSVFGRCHLL